MELRWLEAFQQEGVDITIDPIVQAGIENVAEARSEMLATMTQKDAEVLDGLIDSMTLEQSRILRNWMQYKAMSEARRLQMG